MEITFFPLEPEISHHGEGWVDENVNARLATTNKKEGGPVMGVCLCIPARTYAARHDSICCNKSIQNWLTCIKSKCPKDAVIVIVRTKTDLDEGDEGGSPKKGNKPELFFTAKQAAALVESDPQVVGTYDVSAKTSVGSADFKEIVGKMLVEGLPEGSCVIC